MYDERKKEERKGMVDTSKAEKLLEDAKLALEKGKSVKALQQNRRAREALDRSVTAYQQARGAITRAQTALTNVKRLGLNTTKAENSLNLAEKALSDGLYTDVHKLVHECMLELQSLSFIPGRELTVKTIIDTVQNRTTYEIKIENNTDYVITKLQVLPEIPLYTAGGGKLIANLNPHKEARTIFELKPAAQPAPGELVPGKDVTVQTALRPIPKENRIVYTVWLKNNRHEVLNNIRVIPRLPDVLIPDAKEKLIPELKPGETRGVVFEIRVGGGGSQH